ncbi:MAG: EAL domain-containing protein [Dongiaceae bacterium]
MTINLLLFLQSITLAAVAGWLLYLNHQYRKDSRYRFESEKLSSRHLQDLRRDVIDLDEQMTRSRSDLREVVMLLEEVGKSTKGIKKQEFDAVVGEVRVLQRLVEQLAVSRKVGHGFVADIQSSGKVKDKPSDAIPIVRTDHEPARILAILQEALKSDRIDLYIQPIVSLPQRKRRHFECFSRVRDIDGSIILPEQYVTVAETAGLIAAIDNMLLFRCLQLIRRANYYNLTGLFFINLSKHTLHDKEFFADFVEYLTQYRELARKMVFEIAQEDWENRNAEAQELLLRLSILGCGLAIDRVTNMTAINFSDLTKNHVKHLKLDGKKLLEELHNRDSKFDYRAFQRQVSDRQIDLIIERIEDEKMLKELLEYGLDFGQGYLFGEPKLSKSEEGAVTAA